MYSYIGADITHLHRDHKERIVYLSAEELPDHGFAIKNDSIPLPFVHEPHHDLFSTIPTMITAIQKLTARMHVSIQNNLQFGHVLIVLHTCTTV